MHDPLLHSKNLTIYIIQAQHMHISQREGGDDGEERHSLTKDWR